MFPTALLSSCSLLIDTNPDGVIDQAAAGKSGNLNSAGTGGTNGGSASSSGAAPSNNGGIAGVNATTPAGGVTGINPWDSTGRSGAGGADTSVGASAGATSVLSNTGGTSAAGGTGGINASGGISAAGGVSATGGISVTGSAQGDHSGDGAVAGSTSRIEATGGFAATGGVMPTEGTAGTTGGVASTGGVPPTGGTSATSGTTAECVAGSVQSCTLGNLRGRQTCTADAKLGTCMPMVSLGYGHGCLVTSTGNVKCWGNNNHGQTGQDPEFTPKHATTTRVTTSTSALTNDVISLSAGQAHSCAVVAVDSSTTRTLCWGANDRGQLGATTPTESYTPIVVQGLTDAVAVYAGSNFTCARTGSGQVKCWGANDYGQLGNGARIEAPNPTPTAVKNQVGVLDMDAGNAHNCLISATHRVLCWGTNGSGETGLNGTVPVELCGLAGSCQTEPSQVVNLPADVIEVSAGGSTSCALRSSGAVHCWGSNRYRQLGQPPASGSGAEFPTSVSGLEPAIHIAVGWQQACAVAQSGAAKCWGTNDAGGLGSGEPSTSAIADLPVQVSGLASGVIQILSSAGNTNCAAKADGSLWCWGDNYDYQLGIADVGIQSASVPVELTFTP